MGYVKIGYEDDDFENNRLTIKWGDNDKMSFSTNVIEQITHMTENEFIERGVAAGINNQKCKRLYQLIMATSISVGGLNIDNVCEAFLFHFGKKVL